jgi:hypothetical protein
MFVWREVQTLAGFSDDMVNYRDSLVREINFVFSDRFSMVKEDTKVQKEYELLKNRRMLTNEKITDPIKRSAVEVSLLKDVFHTTLDFNSASLFIRYFGLSIEDIGRDVYFEMKEEKSIYKNLLYDKLFDTAIGFLQFFPRNDALTELEDIFRKAIAYKYNKAIILVVEEMKKPQFIQIIKDNDIRNLLYGEAERAESEKRIEDAKKIAELLGDNELELRLRFVEALVSDEFDRAIENLKEISDKERLRKVIIEYYNEEMKKGMTDIEGYKRAFQLAYYGGFDTEEYRRFIEKPAGKLFEYHILKSKANEEDLLEAENYVEFTNRNHLLNILSEKFLSMIESNETESVMHLKNRFGVAFSSGNYSNEENVKEKYKRLTETAGIFAIPKGEENLKTAMDIAKVFDFREKEFSHINALFCKHYIVHSMFDEAKKYFVPDNQEILELLEKEMLKLIDVKHYFNAYELKKKFSMKFPKDYIYRKKREIREQIRNSDLPIENFAKIIVIDDIFDLDVVSTRHYHKLLSFIKIDELIGSQILTDLKIPIINHAEGSIKVRIYQILKELSTKSPNTANIIFKTYDSILPPTIFDYIIYYIKKFFDLE